MGVYVLISYISGKGHCIDLVCHRVLESFGLLTMAYQLCQRQASKSPTLASLWVELAQCNYQQPVSLMSCRLHIQVHEESKMTVDKHTTAYPSC